MITPTFEFDQEMNGFLSEPVTIDRHAMVHVELASRAPIVTLKRESDGGYANYGMSPKSAEAFEIDITANDEMTVRLATPVEVIKCYILN